MTDTPRNPEQIVSRNSVPALAGAEADTIARWIEAYFRFEVSTSESSRKVQARDLACFHAFMLRENGNDLRSQWTPRLSRAFLDALQGTLKEDGQRRWNDRTVSRIIAHLKTFAGWVHKHAPLPLGCPTEKLKSLPVASSLSIERAVTTRERRRMLDACDILPEDGGRSVDRNRYRNRERPQRASFRPWRNRAIVYLLLETGMRRGAVVSLNLADVNFSDRTVTVTEKGNLRHVYLVSREGLSAVQAYLEHEREQDADFWGSPALFLPANQTRQSSGRLSTRMVNLIWDEVCTLAGVEGRTPHSARHAMGRYIMEKTGNVSAVQRQLGHRNAVYSMQYARISKTELENVLDERK